MLESHRTEGRRSVVDGRPAPFYGQDVTDACMGREETMQVRDNLADAVHRGRDGSG
jgi:3-deoxy-7-phosphoheptulonate synthase